MITTKRETGNKGEDIACKFLEGKKYKIIDRNYLKKYGEIDIVAQKEKTTLFIEVKSVTHEMQDKFSHENDRYRPEDNIHPEKFRRLSNVVQSYLSENNLEESEWKFGVITVILDKKKRIARVKFIEDVVFD